MTTTRRRRKTAKSKLDELTVLNSFNDVITFKKRDQGTSETRTFTPGKGKNKESLFTTTLTSSADGALTDQRANAQMAHKVAELLNKALQTDPDAIALLVNNKVHCKLALADQLAVTMVSRNSGEISALGLLNGVMEMLTGHLVGAYFSPGRGKRNMQRRLQGFSAVSRAAMLRTKNKT